MMNPPKITRAIAKGMPMTYKATITVDFTLSKRKDEARAQNAAYTKMSVALVTLGWRRLETSAFVIEKRPLEEIWTGIEILAKQSAAAGALSALNFQIQGSAIWEGLPNTSTLSGPNALESILALPLPREM